MKSFKNITLILVLGLLLTAFTAQGAQTPPQTEQKKATPESCCCCSDSCDMKMKQDADMKHDMKDCCNAKQKMKDKKAA